MAVKSTASKKATSFQYQNIKPVPGPATLASCVTFRGMKIRSVSVMLETVKKSQAMAAMEITAGSTMARPVKKLARQLAKKSFFTSII